MFVTNKKGLKGVSLKLDYLLEGQNKNPSTLKKLWNNGCLDEVSKKSQKSFRECTLHETLHNLKIKNQKKSK